MTEYGRRRTKPPKRHRMTRKRTIYLLFVNGFHRRVVRVRIRAGDIRHVEWIHHIVWLFHQQSPYSSWLGQCISGSFSVSSGRQFGIAKDNRIRIVLLGHLEEGLKLCEWWLFGRLADISNVGRQMRWLLVCAAYVVFVRKCRPRRRRWRLRWGQEASVFNNSMRRVGRVLRFLRATGQPKAAAGLKN